MQSYIQVANYTNLLRSIARLRKVRVRSLFHFSSTHLVSTISKYKKAPRPNWTEVLFLYLPRRTLFARSAILNGCVFPFYFDLKYSSIAAAAVLPAPIARITVAAHADYFNEFRTVVQEALFFHTITDDGQ